MHDCHPMCHGMHHHSHCNHNHKHHIIRLGQFVILFALFVAFVPGVILKITGGSKDPLFPIIIHGFGFATVYSILSYIYWSHKHAEKKSYLNHVRQMSLEEAALAKLDALQRGQMNQDATLSNMSSKCCNAK